MALEEIQRYKEIEQWARQEKETWEFIFSELEISPQALLETDCLRYTQ